MAPYLIGQCCIDQIITPDPGNPDISGKNEVIPFTNVSNVTLAWNNTRKLKFGDAAVIYVEILGEDGEYRQTSVEIRPNSAVNTTSYFIDLGGLSTGRIVIT